MTQFGISVELTHVPELDPEFMLLKCFNEAFLKGAVKPVSVAVERAGGQI